MLITSSFKFTKTPFRQAKNFVVSLQHSLIRYPPLDSKTPAVRALNTFNSVKKRGSFFGSVHCIKKFIPNLVQLCQPLRPMLRKSTNYT